jgi:hypothetical protein
MASPRPLHLAVDVEKAESARVAGSGQSRSRGYASTSAGVEREEMGEIMLERKALKILVCPADVVAFRESTFFY